MSLDLSCFFYDPADVGHLSSGSPAFSESSLNIWKFSVHILFEPTFKDCDHYLASIWNECNYVVVWTCFGIALLWDWKEDWLFPVLWPQWSFPNLLTLHKNTALTILIYMKPINRVDLKNSYHKETCFLIFFWFFFLLSLAELMDTDETHGGSHFTHG